MKGIVELIIKYITNFGKGKIVSLYIGFACCLCGGYTLKSISYTDGKLKIDFGTLDVIALLLLLVVLIPVLIYLLNTGSQRLDSSKTLNDSLYNKIFELLDIENYQYWAHYISISGDFKLSVKQYENLIKVVQVIQNRVKNKQKSYQKVEDLLDNVALLIIDFINELDKHLITFGSQYYTVDKFYKGLGYNNTNYDKELKEYYTYSLTLSNLTFELTRLLNLLIQEIREINPSFLNNLGKLFICEAFKELPIEYNKNEVTRQPYPGIDEFFNIYHTRKDYIKIL